MSLSDLLKKPARSEIVIDKKGKARKGARGSGFEKELEETCALYAELKVAYIQKFYPPTVFVPPRNGRPGFLMHKKGGKTGFDFIGAIVKTKQAIFIEAKSTELGQIPVWQEDTGIKRHQLETMLWLESVGFECYFLWKVKRADGMVFKLRPRQVIEIIGDTRQLTLAECEEFHIPRLVKATFRGVEVYDFLGEL
jgi:penicillin-binding protein-related factor A (putative recombinase)